MKALLGKSLHFIGVGGISMSALAKYALNEGARVTGSDASASAVLSELTGYGAEVYVGINADKVNNADIVVFSSAIKPENQELVRARELGKKVYERHEFLGAVASEFDEVIAVAGTHGKTTVSAMITHILYTLGASFTANVGGDAIGYGNYFDSARGGEKKLFVAEACEYKRSLLSLKPTVGVITNIEYDHPDCYDNLDSVRRTFFDFMQGSETTVVSYDTKMRYEAASKIENMSMYGNNDICEYVNALDNGFCVYAGEDIYICDNVNMYKNGDGFYERGRIAVIGGAEAELELGLGGCYNVENALFAVAAVCSLGYSLESAVHALKSFKGVRRRFEKTGVCGNADIIFDYAHHPTEIQCALDVAAEYGKVLAVFQPHTYTRTAKYFDAFITAFDNADGVVVMPTYAAREKPNDGVGALTLERAINAQYPKKQVCYKESQALTVDYVKNVADKYDVVIFIGAGDIYNLNKYFRPKLSAAF